MKAIVSIHAPVKGRLALLPQGVAWSRVSIHAPVKGRPVVSDGGRDWSSFNPRPREGATWTDAQGAKVALVSIHAPVKGRRKWLDLDDFTDLVSIHAPVKGRLNSSLAWASFSEFQSTPP